MRSSNHPEKFVLLGFVISLLALLALSGCSHECSTQGNKAGCISLVEGDQLWIVGDKEKELTPAKEGYPFDPNCTFETGPNAKVEFIMKNNNKIRIGSDTKIQFGDCDEKCTTATLYSGTARFTSVSKDAHICVKTPFGDVKASAGIVQKGSDSIKWELFVGKAPPSCLFDLHVSGRSVVFVSLVGTVDFIPGSASKKYQVLPDSFIAGGDGEATSTSRQIPADWEEWNKGRDSKLGQDVAWIAVLACTVATIYCATEYAGCSPRIFASMAMFAMAWAVLLPYYWEVAGNELLASFQGILLALSGGPLRRQADVYRGKERLEVHGWEKYGLWLLLLLILPHFVKLPFHRNAVLEYYPLFDLWLDAILLLLGYLSLGHGVKSLTEAQATPGDKKWWHNWAWLPLALVLFVYEVHEIGFRYDYSIKYFNSVTEATNIPMPTYFLWAYSVLKIFTTGLYLWLVMRTLPLHAKCAVCPELECGR